MPRDVVFKSAVPAQLFEGQRAGFSVTVRPPSVLCVLAIRYTGGRTDKYRRSALKGSATWAFRVPAVPPGPATITVICRGSGTTSTTLPVEYALQAPKLSVGARGFSQAPGPIDGTSEVSYGAAVKNERVHLDAVNVDVLFNFVDSTNRVLGSAHRFVPKIPAGATFYAGGHETIETPCGTPCGRPCCTVARVEVIVTRATSAQAAPSLAPQWSDVVLSPTMTCPLPQAAPNPGYVIAVCGQLLNQRKGPPIQSVDVGIVVLDAGGNILGGFSTQHGSMTFGAREFFYAFTPLGAIRFEKAASALVSPVPTYAPPP